MSISDESFPDDDLISDDNHECDLLLKKSDLTPKENCLSLTGPSSSGGSGDHASYPNRLHVNSDLANIFKKSRMKSKQKYSSWQDMHSQYSQKRYDHVKSKVKQYIAEITAQDQTLHIARHRSLPETLSFRSVGSNLEDDNSNDEGNDATSKEILELKTINQSLKRNVDSMRYELLAEREKNRSRVGILRSIRTPRRSAPFNQVASVKISTGTQTAEFSGTNQIRSFQVPLLNFDSDEVAGKMSSDSDREDFDSAIESNSPENDNELNIKPQRKKHSSKTKGKKSKFFQKRLRKYFLGACCIGTKENLQAEYTYESIPLSDTSHLSI